MPSARPAGRWCAASSCRPTASGVVAASILGLGRALGEAIAVTQVIGAGTHIEASLFETGDTLASRIAAPVPGNLSQLHASSLFYLRLSCSPLASIAHTARSGSVAASPTRERRRDEAAPPRREVELDPTAPLVPSGNLRRREWVSRLAEGGAPSPPR